jgi:hypothetical protein
MAHWRLKHEGREGERRARKGARVSWFLVSGSPDDAERGFSVVAELRIAERRKARRGRTRIARMDGFWITEALRGVRTLKGDSVVSGFQWGQWFGGRAFETRMTRRGAEGTKGGSCFVVLVPFRGYRVSGSPQCLRRLLAQPPATHLQITLITWPTPRTSCHKRH